MVRIVINRRDNYPPTVHAPFFGLPFILRLRDDPISKMHEMATTNGDITHVRLGPKHAYFLSHPDLVHQVLASKMKHFRKLPLQTNALSRIQGPGLVSTEGDFWLRQRRLVQPAFHVCRFKGYCEIVVDIARQWCTSVEAGSVIDIEKAMTHLVVKIIGKMFFNLTVGDQEAAALANTLDVLGTIVKAEFGRPFLLPDWLPIPSNFKRRKAIRTLKALIDKALTSRESATEDYSDLLSMLLLAVDEDDQNATMSTDQVRAESATLFNAAHDSTGAALTWIWYCVANHPDVEKRLIHEVTSVLGDRLVTYNDLPNLQYTMSVVRETLRLYPPVPIFFTREVVEPVELAGYKLPRGAYVFTGPWTLHRNERFFANPNEFDPDRFSPQRIGDIPDHAYIPFGGGPHVCIGRSFAEIEMVLIVATVIQNFRLALADPERKVEAQLRVSLRPRHGLPMQVCPK